MKTALNHVPKTLALVLVLWGANQAKAQVDSINPADYSYTPSNGGELTSGFKLTIDGSREYNVMVGGLLMTAGTGQGVPGYSDFTTVSLDLKGAFVLGSSYTFTEQSFNGQTGLNPAWGNNGSGGSSGAAASQAINNAAYIFSTHENVATPTDWAALQLAVWKALYDTEANGTIVTGANSRFGVEFVPSATSAAWTEAQSWLGALPRTQNFSGYLLSPASPCAPEVLIGVSPVPEPTTLAAGAILFVPFAMTTIRFLRRRSPA
jgi:hypothetical protein